MPNTSRHTHFLLCLCLTTLLGCGVWGCAVVHVHDDSGKAAVRRSLGLVSIQLPETADGFMLTLNGIGAFTVDGSLSLGYVSLQMAAVHPSCHVLFWIENEEQAENIKTLLADIQGICFLQNPTPHPDKGEPK
ncbi:MAG: hypothetical protein ACOY4H_03625 [Thermodesulfobacteriota bacterium]